MCSQEQIRNMSHAGGWENQYADTGQQYPITEGNQSINNILVNVDVKITTKMSQRAFRRNTQ